MYTLVAFKRRKRQSAWAEIVGDGAIICYVQDLIIRPEVQGERYRWTYFGDFEENLSFRKGYERNNK